MKTAYFNCSSGIAGDMAIASLMDAFGTDAKSFEPRLKALLKFKDFGLSYTISNRYHAPCKHMDVTGNRHFGGPSEIRRIITSSNLPGPVKDKAVKALAFLVEAEASVHRVKKEKVHFHELNSVDTLVDITAPLLLLHDNGVGSVMLSPLNLGNPAPATLELVRRYSIPVYSTISTHELTTPTGAALAAAVSDSFGDMPVMTIESSGISCGTMDIPDHRNILKVIIGSAALAPKEYDSDLVVHLATNIDDMDPRVYPYVTERLLDAGALDVGLEQVMMKKGRPGIVVNILAAVKAEMRVVDIMFRETTTLGIRRTLVSRHILRRKSAGETKTSFRKNKISSTRLEYEAAKKLAIKKDLPLKALLD